jgi:hypothetical protein
LLTAMSYLIRSTFPVTPSPFVISESIKIRLEPKFFSRSYHQTSFSPLSQPNPCVHSDRRTKIKKRQK